MEYLPEPYIGCIRNPKAVFLNYNPGPVLTGLQERRGGQFIDELKAIDSYENFARKVPYFEAKGRSFWYPRKRFAARLLGINDDHFNILGLELCPWHSNSFKLTSSEIAKLQSYLFHEVLQVAELAAKNAELSTIISVGKNYYDLFLALGLKQIKESNPNIEHWPRSYNGNPVTRSFSLWESNSGARYLNTYAQGGNTMPSPAFDQIIKEFIE